MKKAIVYVQSEFWGARGAQEQLVQERQCLAYAEELGYEVVRIFREAPWKKVKKGIQMQRIYKYLIELPENSINCLIIQSPRVIARYKKDYLEYFSSLRALGVKILPVIYKNKAHQTNEKENKGC